MRFTIAFIIGRFTLHGPRRPLLLCFHTGSLHFFILCGHSSMNWTQIRHTVYAQRAPVTTLYLRPIHARVATQDEIWERQRGVDEGRARDWAKGRGKGGDAHLSVSWDHVTYYGALPPPTPTQSLFLPCLGSGSTRQANIPNRMWKGGYELTIHEMEEFVMRNEKLGLTQVKLRLWSKVIFELSRVIVM